MLIQKTEKIGKYSLGWGESTSEMDNTRGAAAMTGFGIGIGSAKAPVHLWEAVKKPKSK